MITRDGDEVPYDMLVLALGAHPEREWHSREVLTYHGGRDGPNYRLLLHHLREGRVNKLAFVKPAGASWPLPLYDLALLTAADCLAHDRSGVELSLITPEEEPLGIFGKTASASDPTAPRRMRGERCIRAATAHLVTPVGSTSPPASDAFPLTAS